MTVQPLCSSKRILIAITGASGSIYANRLLEILLPRFERVYLLTTKSAVEVIRYEMKASSLLCKIVCGKTPELYKKTLRYFDNEDFFAPIASGSSAPSHMVVVPCSMGTLARVALGISGTLLERTADVMLKERKPLILVPRESPFSTIHLQHMLSLSQMGAFIIPAMPAFYHHPQSLDDLVDFVVAKILDGIGIEQDLVKPWNQKRS